MECQFHFELWNIGNEMNNRKSEIVSQMFPTYC